MNLNIPTAVSTQEARRLHALRGLELLDTDPTDSFDRITRMAAALFDLPMAAISLTDSDRQWFKSRVGVPHTQMQRVPTPCSIVTERQAVLVIEDFQLDPVLRNSALASDGVRFYAGAPLMTQEGYCLGALCVLGKKPGTATSAQISLLKDLATMVMEQIDLRHSLGRIDAISGLPNRQQFVEDFKDLQNERPHGELRYAVLVNLATPEQISYALRVMGVSYLDALCIDAACWLRAETGANRKIYCVAHAQFALIAPPGVTLPVYMSQVEDAVSRGTALAKTRYVMTPSVGLAPFEKGKSDGLSVLRQARSAAHDAISHINGVAVYSPEADAAYQRRFRLLRDFSDALDAPDQLRLVFQPKVDLKTGLCVGAEALLRWQHPELGPVGPGEFMPVIERSGLAQRATDWVLKAAMIQQQLWRKDGSMLVLSVNVTAANLLEHDFAERLQLELARLELPPDALELEITENALIERGGSSQAMLEAINALGVRLAIDDFGTGYSSLSYLQTMPADVVKIDQSFIRGLEEDSRKQTLVRTMIRLSQDLGFRVVAEGVETGYAALFLSNIGCDEAQGYFFARPLESAAFNCWMESNRLVTAKRPFRP